MPRAASLQALLARFEERSAWPPTRRDWLVAAAWLLVSAVDIALENEHGLSFTDPDPTPVQTWLFLVPFAATVLLRRRAPLVGLVAAYLLACSAAVAGGNLEKGFLPIFQLVYVQFCAAHAAIDRRDTGVALGVGLVGVLGATATFKGGQDIGTFVFVGLMVVVLPTAVARAFRNHERLTDLLAERNAQLEVQRSERERLAVAQERERIAGELHDVVAHGVSAMVIQAGAARRLVAAGGDPQLSRAAIAEVESSGRAALDELRRLLGVLRHDDEALALAPQPSLARVDRLVDRLRAEGLPVELDVTGTVAPLPPGLDVTAYRIVEEALGDVLRGDAAGEPARVAVRYGTRDLELEVVAGGAPRDDGDRGGFGLRERVALFGGELHESARRGGGRVLRARLPLDAAVPA